MAVRKRKTDDAWQVALARVKADPGSEASRQELERALADESWLVVATAAEIVAEHALTGFERALGAVWPRFVVKGPKGDPGCRAKEAALTALDRLEGFDSDPFVAAVRFKQLEPALGGAEDTAGGVRQRALFALLRQRHPDAPLYAGELLADENPNVRAGVCQALGHYGDRASAALLVHKLQAGDGDPNVLAEAAAALLTVAPEFALPLFEVWLRDGEAIRRECAALSLGQSRHPEAVGKLLAWLDEGAWDKDIELGFRALGLSRDERARRYLLDVVERAPRLRAERALAALSVHAYDEQLVARIREAAAKNRGARLEQALARLLRG
jgi:hypothetical protein